MALKATKEGSAKDVVEKMTTSMRLPVGLKKRIEKAADAEGRSLTQEIERRLEQSFRDENTVPGVLSWAYGEDVAGLILGAALVLSKTGLAAVYERAARDGKPASNWMNDPFAYDCAVKALHAWLRYARPEGDPAQDSMRSNGVGNSIYNPVALVRLLQGENDDPASAESFGRRVDEIRDLLGPTVKRLRLDADDKKFPLASDHYEDKSPYRKGGK